MDRKFVGVTEKNYWNQVSSVERRSYVCGYCGDQVGSNIGYTLKTPLDNPSCILICPSCGGPSFFNPQGLRCPSDKPGRAIEGIDDEAVRGLYEEARLSAAAGAHTASVMACRKILMNIAAHKGAGEGKTFKQYVEHLDEKGYIPPDGKVWVDYIRDRANEANHEIHLMGEEDAKALIKFAEMLLAFVYEFPKAVPKKPQPAASTPGMAKLK